MGEQQPAPDESAHQQQWQQQPPHLQQGAPAQHQEQQHAGAQPEPTQCSSSEAAAEPAEDTETDTFVDCESQQQRFKQRVSFASDDAIATIHHLQPSSSAGDLSLAQMPTDPQSHSSSCWMRIKAAVKQLKRDVLALYYALHDPRTPLLSKLLPWLVLAYALSPLDLIPDFIPVLGYLDDLLLLPLGLWLSCKMIPAEVMADSRVRAAAEPLLLHKNWAVATLVFALWCSGLLLFENWLIQGYGPPQLQYWRLEVLAGSGGVLLLGYVVWAVLQVRHERRRWAERQDGLLAGYDTSDSDEV